ncbi:MAG TPA: four helix bundle protein [Tenuifilaceae bacterium]|jgi:four helix bundle protein|nr:four helix bundle protein [Bacteroidales bacterium]HNY08444.1 four helix bundle protein [Tenuifilaceae bacterium]MBP8642944.1 four helix bundle protein [Bacteroidales bacterium]HOA09896.1 four helix bundle protein [Tenuifilaceae bacterium]HOC36715.1 four helix bundle protein [Tenuifilaceae bacterium]
MEKSENKTKSFRDLIVWQKAHALVLNIFQQVKTFPEDQQQMVGDYLCESAMAIATNIVGGYKKKDRDEKLLYLSAAQDALEECRYYIILATDLSLLDTFNAEDLENAIGEASFLLNSYVKSIQRRKEDDERVEI